MANLTVPLCLVVAKPGAGGCSSHEPEREKRNKLQQAEAG